MLDWFRSRNASVRKAKDLYGAVVAAARQPEFFRDYGIPDTLNGRYEMIALLLFQTLERLRVEGDRAEELSRLTLEAFFTDMDDCMREVGIGDTSVPKKVKKAAAGFYERARLYRAAIDAGDVTALADAMAGFVASGVADKERPEDADNSAYSAQNFMRLANHTMAQRERFAGADLALVVDGRAFLQPQHQG